MGDRADAGRSGPDDAEKRKEYSYADGEFHLRPNPNDPNSLWKKNHLDSVLVIRPLENGFADDDELVTEGNTFFTSHMVDAPAAASSETLTNVESDLVAKKQELMNLAVAGKITPEDAVQQYIDQYGDVSATIVEELNAAAKAE